MTAHIQSRCLWDIASIQPQTDHKQPIRTGHASGQLSEETQPRVYVHPSLNRRDQQPTLQLRRWIRRSGITRFEHRAVRGIPGVREIQPPLLNPAAPIYGPGSVGIVKDGMRGTVLGDGGVVVRHAIMRAREW